MGLAVFALVVVIWVALLVPLARRGRAELAFEASEVVGGGSPPAAPAPGPPATCPPSPATRAGGGRRGRAGWPAGAPPAAGPRPAPGSCWRWWWPRRPGRGPGWPWAGAGGWPPRGRPAARQLLPWSPSAGAARAAARPPPSRRPSAASAGPRPPGAARCPCPPNEPRPGRRRPGPAWTPSTRPARSASATPPGGPLLGQRHPGRPPDRARPGRRAARPGTAGRCGLDGAGRPSHILAGFLQDAQKERGPGDQGAGRRRPAGRRGRRRGWPRRSASSAATCWTFSGRATCRGPRPCSRPWRRSTPCWPTSTTRTPSPATCAAPPTWPLDHRAHAQRPHATMIQRDLADALRQQPPAGTQP